MPRELTNKEMTKAMNAALSVLPNGLKPWEFRKDDRAYMIGDNLLLKEYRVSTDEYTGREIICCVKYIMRGSRWML